MVTRPAFWLHAHDLTIGDQHHSDGEAAGEFDCIRLSVRRCTCTGTHVGRCTYSDGFVIRSQKPDRQPDARPPILESDYALGP